MIVETTEEKKWVLTVSVNDGSPAGGTECSILWENSMVKNL